MIRMMTIVGARPQFIKSAALSHVLQQHPEVQLTEEIVHTGQHFDENMSKVFFDELAIPRPTVMLEPPPKGGSASTAKMLEGLGAEISRRNPDLVLVYGDTDSTLAGALAAVKSSTPVVHVEAGLRSGNKLMPEEINRIVTDRVSAINFAPSHGAMRQLKDEGLGDTAFFSGDIMFDAIRLFTSEFPAPSLEGDMKRPFALLTLHRRENTDDPVLFKSILSQLIELNKEMRIVVPVHPRLRLTLEKLKLYSDFKERFTLLEPQSFKRMIQLQRESSLIITDSGGIQKEAFYLRVPCVTLRGETEWPETVALGWNTISNPKDNNLVRTAVDSIGRVGRSGEPYGDSYTSDRIIQHLLEGTWRKYFHKR